MDTYIPRYYHLPLQINWIFLVPTPSIQLTILNNPVKVQVNYILTVWSDQHLQQACLQICKEFPDLWKQELGRLKDYQREVKFKPDVTPQFCKPRTVPFAIQEDLNQAYDAGIAKGIWEPTIFDEYGTTVVPVRKQSLPNQPTPSVRVYGDYSEMTMTMAMKLFY